MNLFSLPYLQLSITVHGINGQKPSGSGLLVAKLRWEDYIIHCGWEFRQWSVTCQVGVSPVYWWVISMTSPDAPNSGFPQRVWPRFVWLSKSHKPRVGKALSHAQNTNLGQHFFSPRTFDPTPVQRTRTHLEVRVLLPHGPTCGRPISAEPRGGTQVRDGIKHMCSLGIICFLSILCVLIMRPMRFFLDPALGLKHGLIFRHIYAYIYIHLYLYLCLYLFLYYI
jgi:hypothetical protein